jgi:hypothetical protein
MQGKGKSCGLAYLTQRNPEPHFDGFPLNDMFSGLCRPVKIIATGGYGDTSVRTPVGWVLGPILDDRFLGAGS